MSRSIVALCASALSCAPASGASGTSGTSGTRPHAAPPGSAGPEAAVTTYFRASDTGASSLLRAAFHPATLMQSVDAAGELRLVSQLDWWQRLDAGKAVPADDRRLEVLDREGPLALVEAVSRWPTHAFHDLLLVAATPDGWRIVAKAFERLEPNTQLATRPEDNAEIRAILDAKIRAANANDPALLASSHTPLCPYVAISAGPPALASVSEWAAIYATRRDRGELGRHQWRVHSVTVRGRIAAAKLDATLDGKRVVDHLLLVRVAAGWRIAAATWAPIAP